MTHPIPFPNPFNNSEIEQIDLSVFPFPYRRLEVLISHLKEVEGPDSKAPTMRLGVSEILNNGHFLDSKIDKLLGIGQVKPGFIATGFSSLVHIKPNSGTPTVLAGISAPCENGDESQLTIPFVFSEWRVPNSVEQLISELEMKSSQDILSMMNIDEEHDMVIV